MVELMLHDTADVIEKIVITLRLARNSFLQPRIGEGCYRFYQLAVSMFGVLNRRAPRRLTGVLYRRKILFILRLRGSASDARKDRGVPGSNVQRELPDAVRVFDGMCRCHLCIDAIEDFEKRIAVPGLSIKGTAYLVGKARSFRHTMFLLITGFERQALIRHNRNPLRICRNKNRVAIEQ